MSTPKILKRGQTANQSLTFNFLYQSNISDFFLHPCLGLHWCQRVFFLIVCGENWATKPWSSRSLLRRSIFAANNRKKTLSHPGYFRVRGIDQKIQKCRKGRRERWVFAQTKRENATRGISWLTGTFHVFKFNQSAVTTSLAFSHATLNDSLLIL